MLCLHFHPAADKEIPSPIKFIGADADKNKVALLIISQETYLLNLLVTHLADTRASLTAPSLNSRDTHISLTEVHGGRDLKLCSSTFTRLSTTEGILRTQEVTQFQKIVVKISSFWEDEEPLQDLLHLRLFFTPAPFFKPRPMLRNSPEMSLR